jgi:hypothetical protein
MEVASNIFSLSASKGSLKIDSPRGSTLSNSSVSRSKRELLVMNKSGLPQILALP